MIGYGWVCVNGNKTAGYIKGGNILCILHRAL